MADDLEAVNEPGKHEEFLVVGVPTIILYPTASHPPRFEDVVHLKLRNQNHTITNVVPVFTDADLAERFIAGMGPRGEGSSHCRPASLDELLLILIGLKGINVTHVTHDPGERFCKPHPIDVVISAIRGAERKAALPPPGRSGL